MFLFDGGVGEAHKVTLYGLYKLADSIDIEHCRARPLVYTFLRPHNHGNYAL